MLGWYKYHAIIPITEIATCDFVDFSNTLETLYKLYKYLIKEDDSENVLRLNPFNVIYKLREMMNDFSDETNIYIGYRVEKNEETNEITYYPEVKFYSWVPEEKIVNVEVTMKND
jgi:hypothetical protein